MSKILVVDDEPDICTLIRRYAEHDGHKTVGVTNGAEAVERCRKEDVRKQQVCDSSRHTYHST